MVQALVMAGGKGNRLALREEKPLLEIGAVPVIERVLTALNEAKKVESIVVAVSPHTPRTAMHMKNLGIKVVKTPGKEYVYDLRYAVKKLRLKTALILASDLPLITGEIIDEVIMSYENCGKTSLAVVVPMATKQKLGLGADYAFSMGKQLVVPAGINVIDGKKIDDEEAEQAYCVIDKDEVAVNINTVADLKIASNLLKKRKSSI